VQAYSSEALAPLTAASPEWSHCSYRQGADSVVASGPVGLPFDAATAAQALASLLLEGLSDQDLAVLAQRLMPHMVEGHLDHARARSAYTVASLAAELGVSAKAVRCAIARHELRAVKRGAVGSFRPTQLASGRPRLRRRTQPPAGALLRSLPLPRLPVPRCGQFSVERGEPHAA
jgi:hypothetical protein